MTAASPSDQGTGTDALDEILTLQLLVAWAGEEGDRPRRLAWWRTKMTDEFGGQDLFHRLMPHTWRWAVLEAARNAAKKVDAQSRRKSSDPDEFISLFHLGFALDETLDDRLAELKKTVTEPAQALPGLQSLQEDWNADNFFAQLADLAPADYTDTAAGRRLKGTQPGDPLTAVKMLAAAHANPTDTYPAPHYRSAR